MVRNFLAFQSLDLQSLAIQYMWSSSVPTGLILLLAALLKPNWAHALSMRSPIRKLPKRAFRFFLKRSDSLKRIGKLDIILTPFAIYSWMVCRYNMLSRWDHPQIWTRRTAKRSLSGEFPNSVNHDFCITIENLQSSVFNCVAISSLASTSSHAQKT